MAAATDSDDKSVKASLAAKLALAAHREAGLLCRRQQAKVRVAYGDENPFFAPQVS